VTLFPSHLTDHLEREMLRCLKYPWVSGEYFQFLCCVM
jgi:hypothetical protein